jgi:hypothetical protein
MTLRLPDFTTANNVASSRPALPRHVGDRKASAGVYRRRIDLVGRDGSQPDMILFAGEAAQPPLQPDAEQLVAVMIMHRYGVMLRRFQQFARTSQSLVFGGKFLGRDGASPSICLGL